MTNVITYEKDSVRIQVNITDERTGEGLSLSGATFVALARRVNGDTDIAATVTVVDETNGIVSVRWSPETFDAALYDWQLRVTINGEVQTVVDDRVLVQRSL